MKKNEGIDEKSGSEPPIHKRRILRKLIFFLLIALIIGSFVYIINTPGQGIIIETKQTSDDETGGLTTKTLVSRYYTVEYPRSYELKTGLTKGAGQLDLQVIQKPSLRSNPGSIRASFGIEVLPAGGVKEMSPHKLATAFPKSYRIETKPCNEQTCTILTKYDDSSAKIILWPHGKNVLVVALSSQTAGTPADYDSLVKQILETLKWNQ